MRLVSPQALPSDLTDEQMRSAAAFSLVEDMVSLQQSLTSLSHLGEAGEQEVSAVSGLVHGLGSRAAG